VEIVCGALLIAGLLTRLATIPLLIDMVVAIATTKIAILRKSGLSAALHESRTDYSMLLGCLFLLLAGGGELSLDARLARPARAAKPEAHPRQASQHRDTG
jgi:uncharacterized membrane protein YphA (DoxX/SURF4 family)